MTCAKQPGLREKVLEVAFNPSMSFMKVRKVSGNVKKPMGSAWWKNTWKAGRFPKKASGFWVNFCSPIFVVARVSTVSGIFWPKRRGSFWRVPGVISPMVECEQSIVVTSLFLLSSGYKKWSKILISIVSLGNDFCVSKKLSQQVVVHSREVVDTYLQGGLLEANTIEVIRLESKQQIRAMERQKKACLMVRWCKMCCLDNELVKHRDAWWWVESRNLIEVLFINWYTRYTQILWNKAKYTRH